MPEQSTDQTTDPTVEFSAALRAELLRARKARDKTAAAGLQTLLGAVANAEAVAVEAPVSGAAPPPESGLYAAEVPRRRLTATDLVAIVERETAELAQAAAEMDALGQTDVADELRAKLAVLCALGRPV